MNGYKNIIKSKETRIKILHFLSFMPDKLMIYLQYYIKTGQILNLKNPHRYTEKLQWYKLYYRTSLMTKCADKYKVREYVQEKKLEFLLNDIYGFFTSPEEIDNIDFEKLPTQFVIKSNTGSGNNIIVQNKEKINVDETKKTMKSWLKKEASLGREWCYDNIEPGVLIEKFIGRDKNNDLPDYKFFCFDGRVYCMYTMVNYTDNHENGQLGFYDREYNKMPVCRKDFRDIDFQIEKPRNYEKMVEYAEILARDFPHARVDFYNMEGKIIFGEITFYNASGYTRFEPDSFDFDMGEQFVLPAKKKLKKG